MMIKLFDYLGSALIILGAVLVGRKIREGFLIFTAACICFFILGISLKLKGLIILNSIMFMINFFSYIFWKNKQGD